MMTPEKKAEIRKRLKKGIPEGEIKEELIREGYSPTDLDEAFAPAPYDMKSWYLTFAVLLLAYGVYLFVTRNSLLVLVFSAALFFQYYRETVRLSKTQTPTKPNNKV